MARANRPADAHDPSRREFFRTFSRQTVHNAGAVIGAAAELRRNSIAAARELLDPRDETVLSVAHDPGAGAESRFRSPYRLAGDEIVIVDQRELPGRVSTIGLRAPSEVASAIRSSAVNAGPVLAQVVAYAMVLAARTAYDRPDASRQHLMRTAADTLRAARRDVRALAWAVDRMENRYHEAVANGTDAATIADVLLAAADAIASDAAVAHSAIGRSGAELLGGPDISAVNLLVHGDMGPLSCGMVGMGTALIQALTDAGHQVHVWLTEAGPGMEGARVSSLQLAQTDVAHTVISDSAVGWLLSNRHIDVVLLRGDRICANGDTGALIGSLGVAWLASNAGVPVYVLAPLVSIDHETPDGSTIAVELRATSRAMATHLNPTVDVVPAELISSIVTEVGALAPPFAKTLAAAARTGTS